MPSWWWSGRERWDSFLFFFILGRRGAKRETDRKSLRDGRADGQTERWVQNKDDSGKQMRAERERERERAS